MDLKEALALVLALAGFVFGYWVLNRRAVQ